MRFVLKHTLRQVVVVIIANITLRLVWFQIFPCALSQISNHTSPQGDVCTKTFEKIVMFCKRQLRRAIIGNQQEGQWQLTIANWQSTRAMSRRISCCEVLSKVLRQRRPVTEIVFDLVASFEQVFYNTIVVFEIIAFHKNFSLTQCDFLWSAPNALFSFV